MSSARARRRRRQRPRPVPSSCCRGRTDVSPPRVRSPSPPRARRASSGRQALAGPAATGLEIDCSGVSAADSAGLAVLIDWLAAARAARRTLRYSGLPAGLAALGRISEVQELLERGV